MLCLMYSINARYSIRWIWVIVEVWLMRFLLNHRMAHISFIANNADDKWIVQYNAMQYSTAQYSTDNATIYASLHCNHFTPKLHIIIVTGMNEHQSTKIWTYTPWTQLSLKWFLSNLPWSCLQPSCPHSNLRLPSNRLCQLPLILLSRLWRMTSPWLLSIPEGQKEIQVR